MLTKQTITEIRPATPADYEAIVRLIPSPEELFRVYPNGQHPFTSVQLHALAEARKELTVLVCEGQIAGFANLYNVQPGHSAFIGNVVIDKRFRGQGFGRRLVTHMIDVAFAQYTLEQVHLSVFSDNTTALLLYSGLGFAPYGVEERRTPAGERVALIHMCLNRSPN